MKTPNEFIDLSMNKIRNKFPGAKLRYKQLNSGTHCINILPLNLYDQIDYKLFEINIEDKFYKLFPREDIMFISEGSLTQI